VKRSYPRFLVFAATCLTGCTTHYHTRYPDLSERTVAVITTLYEETRTQETTNNICRYVLGPDRDTVVGAEALLLHYSRNEDPAIRAAAACHLAHFGTRPALSRAIELARTENSSETRAGIWCAIAELLQEPLTWPAPQVYQANGSTIDTNLAQVLTSPGLQVVLSCFHRPADFILPGEYPLEAIEDAIVSQFACDNGEWSVEVVDRIPFVPFSGKRYTATLTVRQAIANTLQWTACGNERILRSFQEFNRSEDERISEPAKAVVSALYESDAIPNLKLRGSNHVLNRTR